VDGSPDSRAVVEVVASRAWPAGTEVTVMAVDESIVALADPAAVLAPQMGTAGLDPDWADRTAAEAAARLQGAGNLKVTIRTRAGSPRQVLVEEAEQDGADCIFVGAKGLRGVSRFLLGSVSTAVAMNAPCTVEVVRPGGGGAGA
jgi:nucleotide-binding universal stress UspA family protein